MPAHEQDRHLLDALADVAGVRKYRRPGPLHVGRRSHLGTRKKQAPVTPTIGKPGEPAGWGTPGTTPMPSPACAAGAASTAFAQPREVRRAT